MPNLLYFFFCFPLLYLSLADDIEENYCTADLDSLLLLVSDLHVHVVRLHQRPEFRFVVEDVEATAVEFDVGMVAGDRDISDADLAFVPTTKLYACLWNILNHHHAFTLFASPFENHIVVLGFLNW